MRIVPPWFELLWVNRLAWEWVLRIEGNYKLEIRLIGMLQVKNYKRK